VLVDCGNSPNHARRILAALAQISAPPIGYLIYTHHHWDHVFGSCVFNAPAIGHMLCRERLLKRAAEPWSAEYLQQEIEKNPRLEISYTAIGRAINDWSEFRIVPPNITISHKMSLHLDGLTIDIEHVGGQHASDSLVVRVMEPGIVFLGDCFYAPSLNERTPESKMAWNLLESLVDNSINAYVDSHSSPATREQVVDYLTQVKV
jgi:glyoxylase-like metal-dependent hydrolase (beta-lactamase superfamily II)